MVPPSDDRAGPFHLGPLHLGWWLLGTFVALLLWWVASRFVGVLSFAAFLYYFGRPIRNRLEPRLGTDLGTAVTVIAIVAPFVLVLAVFLVVVVGQVLAATAGGFDWIDVLIAQYVSVGEITSVRDAIDAVITFVQTKEGENALRTLFDLAPGLLGTFTGIFFDLTLLFVIVTLALRQDRHAARWIRDTLAPTDTVAHEYLASVDRELERIFVGQMLTIFAVMVVAWLLYSLLNLVAPPGVSIPFPLLLGLLTGVASLIPLVGRSTVYVPLALYLGAQSVLTDVETLWFAPLVLLGGLFGLDPLVRYGIRPYLAGQRISPALLLVAYLFGAAIFGWYGVFLAPILLVVVLQFFRLVLPGLVGGDRVPTSGATEASEEPAVDATEGTATRESTGDPGIEDGRGSGE